MNQKRLQDFALCVFYGTILFAIARAALQAGQTWGIWAELLSIAIVLFGIFQLARAWKGGIS